MARRNAQNVQEVTQGGVTLKVYRVNRGDRTIFSVAHNVDSRRKLKQFSSEAAAVQWAMNQAAAISKGKPATIVLPEHEGALYRRAQHLLAGTGKGIDEAINDYRRIQDRARTFLEQTNKEIDHALAEYVEAQGILNGLCTLPEAANFYKRRHGSVTRKTVPEIFDELIADRKGARPAYLIDLRSRLGRFKRDFTGFIGDLTHVEIGAWLRSMKLSERSKFNHLRTIKTLFKFAQERGYLAQGETEPERVKIRVQDETEISIFTVTEMRRLLGAAKRPELPHLVFGAFAGVRTTETGRLRWEEINRDAPHFEIKASRAKTRSRRLVPISNNLRAWLVKIGAKQGPVSPLAPPDANVEALAARCEPAVQWRRNALRHSYASYRLAMLDGNENQLAMELGNSPGMIFKHYRALATKEQAEAWFSIVPDKKT